MKAVYITTILADAELVRVQLRESGIRSFLDGENVGIRGPATPITVSVKDEEEARSRKVVGLILKRAKMKRRPSTRRPRSK